MIRDGSERLVVKVTKHSLNIEPIRTATKWIFSTDICIFFFLREMWINEVLYTPQRFLQFILASSGFWQEAGKGLQKATKRRRKKQKKQIDI